VVKLEIPQMVYTANKVQRGTTKAICRFYFRCSKARNSILVGLWTLDFFMFDRKTQSLVAHGADPSKVLRKGGFPWDLSFLSYREASFFHDFNSKGNVVTEGWPKEGGRIFWTPSPLSS